MMTTPPWGRCSRLQESALVRLLGGLLRGLNDTVLRGAQSCACCLQDGLQLLAAALAQAIQAARAGTNSTSSATAPASRQPPRLQPSGCRIGLLWVACTRCTVARGAGAGFATACGCGRGHVGRGLHAPGARRCPGGRPDLGHRGAQGWSEYCRGVQFAALVVVQRLQQAVAPGVLATRKTTPWRLDASTMSGVSAAIALQLRSAILMAWPQDLAAVVADGLRQK